MIQVQSLQVTYTKQNVTVPAIQDVSFRVEEGSSCAIIGPSGCGKTTLLYVLAGLLPGFTGRVLIKGEPVRSRRLGTAVILQDYGLLPWKTVWENAVLGLQVRKTPKEEIKTKVSGILQELGLQELAALYPSQLSGGQRQRLAIARALALRPDVLLMDEPFSSLDALTRETLQENLLHVWQRNKITMVIVTHSIEEAVFLGEKIIVMSPRPATCLAQVTNEGVGGTGWRKDKEFHDLSTHLRELLTGKGHSLCAVN